MKLPLTLLLAGLSTGCGWNQMNPTGNRYIDVPLWDPNDVVLSNDGLYVSLPYSGGLALVKTDGTYSKIDIGEGALTQLEAAPSGSALIAIVNRYFCESNDPATQQQVKLPSHCYDEDDLSIVSSVEIIRDGAIELTADISGAYNNITFSNDDRYAITYMDMTDPSFTAQGVMDLTSVMIIDLQDNTATPVRVGFSANRVLFTYDNEGQAEKAVVLSQNSVAVVDLFSSPAAVEVTFPLTLDPDSSVSPVGVEMTPDGQYALISVAGKSDLYALDLLNHSVNMIELSGTPASMVVNAATDQTMLVFSNKPTVDVLKHDYFDIVSYTLDESMSDIIAGEDFALLYTTNKSRRDLYHLDLIEEKVIEYRLQNPALSVHLAPTEDFAIALTSPSNGFSDDSLSLPGMELIDLANEKQHQFALEGNGLGVAFSATETSLHALLLQENTEYIYKYELYTGQAEEIDLSAPPKAIGTLADGTFYITHDAGAGLISFMEPSTGEIIEAAGFATLGLMDSIELMSNEEEE